MWKKLYHRFIEGDKDGTETEFLPSILEVTETPPSPVGRLVLWTIVALLIAGAIWAFVGEVDEVAVARGHVIPTGNVKVVQSQNKGAIKDLLVREGDYVQAGQTLVVLDTTKTQADVDQLKKQVAYYKMTVERLQAEMNDEPFLPPDNKDGDLDQKDISAQTALYNSRRAKLMADQEKNAAAIAQERAAIESAQAQQQKYISLYEVALEKEQRLEMLFKESAVSYFQLLEGRARRVEYQKSAEAMDQEIQKEQAKLAEAMDNQATTDSAYRQETMTQLVEAKRQLNAYQEELTKANETNVQSEITAPVSGRVNQLAVHTVGGVVSEGQGLMMIVPEDATLEIEAYADNKDIGFIQVGQEAEVKVTTFNFQKFGMVNAEVAEISPDVVQDDSNKERNGTYRLTLSLEGDASGIDLSPGMEVTAEIKIKKKRIIDFFLDPFRQYKDEALRER
ncbi:MAG: HlyD family type I secretion periplasmic adaptor subunit [Selenomonas ruminantium]|nr:HlyD family type I secretion periplasmic adaptor subunit [Selenomonas ruminantium]